MFLAVRNDGFTWIFPTRSLKRTYDDSFFRHIDPGFQRVAMIRCEQLWRNTFTSAFFVAFAIATSLHRTSSFHHDSSHGQ